MTAWIFCRKLWWLPLTAGCVKLQLPASSSRVGHNGEHVQAIVLAPVSICFIAIMLKPVTYTSRKQSHICLWWLMIPYESFWHRRITLLALTGYTVLRTWRCSSHTPTLHDRMCKAKTPVVEERCVMLELEASRRSRLIWWWFWTYFDVNTFDTKLFSHVMIGIDHSWLEVTATTPSWFVVQWGRPLSCALGCPRTRQQINWVLLP